MECGDFTSEIHMTEPLQDAYLALPRSGQGPGVLVLHAWWGLTDFFRDCCDRLAGEGFVALAPDLYSGKVARTIDEAERLSAEFQEAQVVPPIVLSAVEALRQRATLTQTGVGTIGFSMGGFLGALVIAAEAGIDPGDHYLLCHGWRERRLSAIRSRLPRALRRNGPV